MAFACCIESVLSTTGWHMCLEGVVSQVPIQAIPNMQDSNASPPHSADIVAAHSVVRIILMHAHDIWAVWPSRPGMK